MEKAINHHFKESFIDLACWIIGCTVILAPWRIPILFSEIYKKVRKENSITPYFLFKIFLKFLKN